MGDILSSRPVDPHSYLGVANIPAYDAADIIISNLNKAKGEEAQEKPNFQDGSVEARIDQLLPIGGSRQDTRDVRHLHLPHAAQDRGRGTAGSDSEVSLLVNKVGPLLNWGIII